MKSPVGVSSILLLIISSSAEGQVTSFNARTGAVTGQAGDYTASQVTNAAATNTGNLFTAHQTIDAGYALRVNVADGTATGRYLELVGEANEIKFKSRWPTGGAADFVFYRTNLIETFRIGSANTAASPLLKINGDSDTGLFHPAADTIAWATAGVEHMRLTSAGDLSVTGKIEGGQVTAHYQDIAEWVHSRADLDAGTVVVLDPGNGLGVLASIQAYDTSVAGVVSKQPGVVLGEAGTEKEMIATTGRVRVKVTAANGAIGVGDLLVTSDVPGVAMKSKPVEVSGIEMHRPGTIIGKALQPQREGEGEILVLLSLQ